MRRREGQWVGEIGEGERAQQFTSHYIRAGARGCGCMVGPRISVDGRLGINLVGTTLLLSLGLSLVHNYFPPILTHNEDVQLT